MLIERTLYGPVSYLAPDERLEAWLEISGIRHSDMPCTVHVFLEEVKRDTHLEELKADANYAGAFRLPDDLLRNEDSPPAVRLEITRALKKAKAIRPNFHITLLTEYDRKEVQERVFQFDTLHIEHVVPLNTKLNISADVMVGLGKNEPFHA